MALTLGTRFDHYEIIVPLGAGGMGEVYRARDTRLDREVAIKVLPASVANDGERLRRFAQEARAVSTLNHPNIITIHEVGEASTATGALHFIVTELVNGNTLREQMSAARLSLPAALEVVVQIASALAAAHTAGIIHRDIKPENVMLRPDGLVKVLDFGLAKLTEKRTSPAHDSDAPTALKANTDPGTVMGTAQYMSPEQARGQEVDARSDIFSLGALLYEMLTRRPAFAGVNALDVVGSILHQEPPPLKQPDIAPEVNHELQRIVGKALRKDREQRYQTSKDLLNDLKDLKQEIEFEAKLKSAQAFVVPPSGGSTQAREIPPEGGTTNAQLADAATNEVTAARATSSAKIIFGEIKRHKLGVALTLILLLAAVSGYFAFFARGPIDSLAILPFANASGDPEMEYLSDGLTESLINSLAQLPRLRVLPRTTIFRFKGKADDPQRIGQELGVRAVLTGRVQQRGDSLVIQTELIDVAGEAQLWGERYDRKIADLLAVQREVAQAIAGGLRLKLSGAEQQQLVKKETENNEAYQLYLKGQFWRNKRGQERKGIEYLNQALEKDPNYAPAWATLAVCYTFEGGENIAKGKAAALKALALDDKLAEAHAALGYNLLTVDWDFTGAEKAYKRALELGPESAITHRNYAIYLNMMGRPQEALAEATRALQLDPLTSVTKGVLARVHLQARQYDQAIRHYRELLEMEPGFVNYYAFLSAAYVGKGRYEEAIAIAQSGLKAASRDQRPLGALGVAYARASQPAEAKKVLAQLLALGQQRGGAEIPMAQIYSALGDRDQAFAWLQKAYDARRVNLLFLKGGLAWDSLRSDPRFAELVRRIGLPE